MASHDIAIPKWSLAWLSAFNRTTGLLDGASADGMKRGYVRYPDGKRSVNMPVGNARDYAALFGGYVCYPLPPDEG